MQETSFYQLLLISALAFLVPFVTARVPQRVVPAVVGEIIAGVVIGTSGFDLIDPTEILDFLAEFGFAYLMFLSGLELDPNLLTATGERARAAAGRIERALRSPLGSGAALLAGTMAIAFGAVLILELVDLAPDLWLTTLVLSTTSVGVVVPTLKDNGLTGRPLGQTILVAAFFADFVTLLLISAFAVVKREGPNAELALILALPAAFFLAYYLSRGLGQAHILSRTMEELAHATGQLQVRGALVLMLAFVVLAETIGSELILGSFIAGVIVSLLSPEEGSSLRIKLDAIGYGFFIPIFFINVGVGLDLGALGSSARELGLLPIFIVVAYASKIVPALLLRLRFSWQETFASGALLSSRLSLIIAASIIGVDLGIITPGVNSAIVLVAVVTSSLSPIVFSRLMQAPARESSLVIIVGAGETGRSLATRLAAHGSRTVLIDADGEAVREARAAELSVVEGRGPSALREAGIESASTLVAVTPDDDYNLGLCRWARDEFGVAQLVARVNDPNRRSEFIDAGVRTVSVPLSISAALENAVLRPNLFQLLVDQPKEYDVLEVALRNRSIIGRRLREVRLPGSCLVLLIRRDGELIVPRGSTVLQDWDYLTVAGDTASVQETAVYVSSLFALPLQQDDG